MSRKALRRGGGASALAGTEHAIAAPLPFGERRASRGSWVLRENRRFCTKRRSLLHFLSPRKESGKEHKQQFIVVPPLAGCSSHGLNIPGVGRRDGRPHRRWSIKISPSSPSISKSPFSKTPQETPRGIAQRSTLTLPSSGVLSARPRHRGKQKGSEYSKPPT